MGFFVIYNCAAKIGRVQSDIAYLEESVKDGIVPKGFSLRWTPQGLDRETKKRVETLLTSSGFQIMEVVIQGLRRKEEYLQDRIAWELNRYRDDERAEIRRQVITTGEEMKMEADGVKRKKRERDIAERTRKLREEEEEEDWVVQLQAGDVQAREEAVAGEEEVVPDSWEERFQEGENVYDFERRIFDSEDKHKEQGGGIENVGNGATE
jgi:hypothetical protein